MNISGFSKLKEIYYEGGYKDFNSKAIEMVEVNIASILSEVHTLGLKIDLVSAKMCCLWAIEEVILLSPVLEDAGFNEKLEELLLPTLLFEDFIENVIDYQKLTLFSTEKLQELLDNKCPESNIVKYILDSRKKPKMVKVAKPAQRGFKKEDSILSKDSALLGKELKKYANLFDSGKEFKKLFA